ncbi:hypothetical protein PHLGIDRAFT_368058 [Phlebiopsis gigantea 11061_1 CR5-6]|uniref:Uncharacterized protein n=1 Tax=Phlebiopsis gigantea (strain 11061_1 CR5-6) TaxID=745531 RepID=A0A0C3SDS1_PHLG1|nr:hypothetical protein PHLGIDRAFT_368058 [Phlebiopsis gigantea 11061_1 CR5-6]
MFQDRTVAVGLSDVVPHDPVVLGRLGAQEAFFVLARLQQGALDLVALEPCGLNLGLQIFSSSTGFVQSPESIGLILQQTLDPVSVALFQRPRVVELRPHLCKLLPESLGGLRLLRGLCECVRKSLPLRVCLTEELGIAALKHPPRCAFTLKLSFGRAQVPVLLVADRLGAVQLSAETGNLVLQSLPLMDERSFPQLFGGCQLMYLLLQLSIRLLVSLGICGGRSVIYFVRMEHTNFAVDTRGTWMMTALDDFDVNEQCKRNEV